MPRTRPFDSYPTRSYLALVRKVADSGQSFTVPCSRTQAASMRGELFAWRRACEAEQGLARAAGVDLAQLRTVTWRVTNQGLECLFTTSLPGPKLIEDALGLQPEQETRNAAQRALDSLRGLIQENPK